MGLERIVCLANSYKHNNRCVAGISLATKQWIRLIGNEVSGGLTREQTCYPDGTEARVLDLMQIELGDRCGSNYHPEDVLVISRPWRFLRRFDNASDTRFLLQHSGRHSSVMRTYSDRLYRREPNQRSLQSSLELVEPGDLWWWIREDKGKRKNRALFRVGSARRVRYDLAVTDPEWLEKMQCFPAGIYPHAALLDEKPRRTFLTVSLSEPFEGFHYKLVAGVINLPGC